MTILEFPECKQTYEYDCGANALQSVLRYYGIEKNESVLIELAKTDPKEGTSIRNIINVFELHGLRTYAHEMEIESLIRYIDNLIPIVMLVQAWNGTDVDYTKDTHDGHWVVAIGYDEHRIIFEDPYVLTRAFVTYEELKKRWHAVDNGTLMRNFGIAVYGKEPTYSLEHMVHMQ